MCQWTMIMKPGLLFQIPSTKPVWNAPSGEIMMTSFPVGYLLWVAFRKSWSFLQNTSWTCACSTPWRRNHDDVISGWLVTMGRIQEVMVVPSKYVMNMCVQHPLAEKSRWRHIRLAIKLRYLGNHASQVNSYYGTLSGSHGRSFRICHENLPKASPSGEITMTSYPACNKTSLSRKLCITSKKLLWVSIRKSCSLFQNPSWIIIWSAPRIRNHDDVISGLQSNLVSSETMHPR